jgi:hypothetical protein
MVLDTVGLTVETTVASQFPATVSEGDYRQRGGFVNGDMRDHPVHLTRAWNQIGLTSLQTNGEFSNPW